MPKIKQTISSKLNDFVKTYGATNFKTDGSVLFCLICEQNVVADRKSSVDQHLITIKHKTLSQKKENKQQQLISSFQKTSKKSEFNMDLCRAIISANIPFYKIQNSEMRRFLEKYTNKIIPDESTLRKSYLKSCYDESMDEIKNAVRGKKIWVSIDETTDIGNRFVANVVIGTLTSECKNEIFLLNTVFLEKTNSSTIARLFDDSMKLIPEMNRYDILLFVTDEAPYMIKAASGLNTLYPKMIHLTCLDHGLSRLCEKIRSIFPDVDKFVSNLKKIFLKSPARVEIFKNIAPENIPLPPKPVLTRMGTWINSVVYCCNNFELLEKVLNSFDPKDFSSAVEICKNLITQITLKNDICFIAANYGFICNTIKQLEERNMLLVKSLEFISSVKIKIDEVRGNNGEEIKKKFNSILNNNKHFITIKNIGKILAGENNIKIDYSPKEIEMFKYAPLTSCDVERSFSLYNNIVTDKRLCFTEENLKFYVVSSCNSRLN